MNYLDDALTTAGCITAIADAPMASALSVWPVPADDVLRFSGTTPVRMEIFDTEGRMVSSSQELRNSGELTVGHLTPGLYLVTLRDRAGTLIAQRRVPIVH